MQYVLQKQSGTWKWGVLVLVIIVPFFFLTYGFSNQYAASLPHVPSIYWQWEKYIPLWPWTIVPYWSIDLFYGLSLLLCWNKFELKQHALRLFLAQIISISCFLLFPLKFSFDRPELSGFFGLLFDLLMGFDKPFNQAPSLHIVLLVILWDFYRRHCLGYLRWIVDFWSFLIAISVLTTWQHHFIDIPTGIIVGVLCLWAFPITVKSPFQRDTLQQFNFQHFKIGFFYLIGAILLISPALIFRSYALWLAYPAFSLYLVCLAYWTARPHFFQKQSNGQFTAAGIILFAPYLCFARLNSRIWTKKHPEDSFIITHQNIKIFLGRIPTPVHLKRYHVIFDCCAELPIYLSERQNPYQAMQTHTEQNLIAQFHTVEEEQHIHSQPERFIVNDVTMLSKRFLGQFLSLDLIPLNANQLSTAVDRLNLLIQQQHQHSKRLQQIQYNQSIHQPLQFQESLDRDTSLFIFCALGYSRSTAILTAWLINQGYANTVLEAIALVQKSRPWIVLKEAQIQQINLYLLKQKGCSP